jgi:hypothetical protein
MVCVMVWVPAKKPGDTGGFGEVVKSRKATLFAL